MIRILSILLVLLAPFAAAAQDSLQEPPQEPPEAPRQGPTQDWTLRPDEVPLTLTELRGLVSGNLMRPFDFDLNEGPAQPGLSISYREQEAEGISIGRFDFEADGRVCFDFFRGYRSCDFHVRQNGLTVRLNERLMLFPIRTEMTLRP